MPNHTHCAAGAWRDFQANAATAPDLDALISHHESFLSALMGRALLDDSSAQVGGWMEGRMGGWM